MVAKGAHYYVIFDNIRRVARLHRSLEPGAKKHGWFGLERERWGKLPAGRGLGLACGSYLCGAGLPIYWNHMPQSGVQLRLEAEDVGMVGIHVEGLGEAAIARVRELAGL